MKNINFKWTDFLAGLLGAIIGGIIGGVTGYALENSFVASRKWIQFAAVGGALGFFILLLYRWLISGREVILESTEITLFGAAKIKVNYTDAHRMIGWKIFVEAATRISTQSLGQNDGSIREALASLYKLFDIVRTELKTQLPSAPPEQTDAYTIESYAVRMLNDALRPMLSRWHPRLARWEKMGRPECDWGLVDLCRKDLETTRQRVLVYVRGLGEILKISDLNNLLPSAVEAQAVSELIADEVLNEAEAGIINSPDDAHRAAGWRIFVELASRISTQPLKENTGKLREALNSLYKLYELIRTETKQLAPPQYDGREPEKNESCLRNSVESISLSILNGDLRAFLSKWHPLLLEQENRGKSETEWPQAAECRAELENLRHSLLAQTKRLGELIKIRVDDYLPENSDDPVS